MKKVTDFKNAKHINIVYENEAMTTYLRDFVLIDKDLDVWEDHLVSRRLGSDNSRKNRPVRRSRSDVVDVIMDILLRCNVKSVIAT